MLKPLTNSIRKLSGCNSTAFQQKPVVKACRQYKSNFPKKRASHYSALWLGFAMLPNFAYSGVGDIVAVGSVQDNDLGLNRGVALYVGNGSGNTSWTNAYTDVGTGSLVSLLDPTATINICAADDEFAGFGYEASLQFAAICIGGTSELSNMSFVYDNTITPVNKVQYYRIDNFTTGSEFYFNFTSGGVDKYVRFSGSGSNTFDADIPQNGTYSLGPPVITEGDSKTVRMSEDSSPTPFALTLNADKNNITWSISSAASNGKASVSATNTGSSQTISYTPNAHFNGNDSFVVQASDGDRSDTITINVTIDPVNDSPTGTVTIDGTAVEGQTLTANTNSISDQDSLGALHYQWLRSGVNISGANSRSYTLGNSDVGETMSVTVSYVDGDNTNEFLTSSSTNAVAGIDNYAPVISGSPITSIAEGAEYSFIPTVNDQDGDQLVFSIINMPSWANFNTTTGELSGIPENGDVATYQDIIISVTDGKESSSLAAFAIDVTPVNDAPVARDMNVEVAEDGSLTIVPEISDIDSDNLAIILGQNALNGSVQTFGNSFLYQPNADFNGQDSFSFTVSDGELLSAEHTISINVTPVNDAPLAEDDAFNFESNESGVYMLTVLTNDQDIDGDNLIIEGAETEQGQVTIEGETLNLSVDKGLTGTIAMSYSVRDESGLRDRAEVTVTITGNANNGLPELTVPGDLVVNAQGLYTDVDLGIAKAIDPTTGNALAVTLVDGITYFAPGRYNVAWSAENTFGQTIATQKLDVLPLISTSKDQKVTEGQQVTFSIILNGDSPTYPVLVPLTVSGSAERDVDYALSIDEAVIEQGRELSVTIDVFADTVSEQDETIVIAIDDQLNKGAKNTFVATISEQNIAPEIALSVTQSNEQRFTVAKDNGLVTVFADVRDVNADDTVTLFWQFDGLQNQANSDEEFVFDPSTLESGVYTLGLTASDDHPNGSLSNTDSVNIQVIDTFTVLSDELDSDGDLIPDAQEGYADKDLDGIPDFKDAIAECNVVPQKVDAQQRFLVESEPGVCLRLGQLSIQGQNGGVKLEQSEADVSLGADANMINVGGIFDFVMTDLTEAGQVVNIVIPQTLPIPAGAIYRKFVNGTWINFVEDEDNKLSSAPGLEGMCPAPQDAAYQPGLIEGHWCVQLSIKDGGPNDVDGEVNSTVVDPGGVAVVAQGNSAPEAQDDEVIVKLNTPVTIDVLANDTDADGDTLDIVSAVANFGDVVINADNSLTFTPNVDYVGMETITYVVSDNNGGISTAKVDVQVIPNTVPVAADDIASTRHKDAIEIDVLANDIDEDNDPLMIDAAVADVGSVTITDEQTLLYQPSLGYDGVVTITYTITDSFSKATAEVQVNVTGNQNPVAQADVARTDDKTPIQINVVANDSDADLDTLSVVDAIAQQGTVSVSNDGKMLDYTPKVGFIGTDTIVYTLSDGFSGTAEGTVTVTVTAQNNNETKNASSGGSVPVWLIYLTPLLVAFRRGLKVLKIK